MIKFLKKKSNNIYNNIYKILSEKTWTCFVFLAFFTFIFFIFICYEDDCIQEYIEENKIQPLLIYLFYLFSFSLIIPALICYFLRKIILKKDDFKVSHFINRPTLKDICTHKVIYFLRRRAKYLRISAGITQFFICVSLVSGFLIFGTAEQSALPAPTREASETFLIISLLSTKIGSAVILLFLVQLLVFLYRYNIKLAVYYDSRADILQLCKDEELYSLNNLERLLNSEKVDFGNSPKMPLKQIVEMFKTVQEELDLDKASSVGKETKK